MCEKNVIVGLYVRVSTTEQAKEGYSLGEQEDRLRKYADAHGWVVYRCYADPGFSGAKMERPALQMMLDDVRNGRLNKVLVYKLDRLSRRQRDTLYMIEDVFNACGCDFVSMTEQLDTGTPLGRAMIGILSSFAQLEREQIKERMRLGREARAKSGRWSGSWQPPYGYTCDENRNLIIDPYSASIVHKIFDMYIAGMSFFAIAEKLNEEGYRTNYGHRFYYHFVERVLSSYELTGGVSYCGERYDGNHEAIISREVFDKVQGMLEKRDRHPHSFRTSHLLSGGIMVCGECGAAYRFLGSNGYRYYMCGNRIDKRDNKCYNSNIKADEIEGEIISRIKSLAFDDEYFRSIVNGRSEERDVSVDIAAINEKISNIEKRRKRLMDLYEVDGIDFDDLNKRIGDLAKQQKGLADEKDAIIASGDSSRLSVEEALSVINSINDVFENGTVEEQRNVISALIDAIVVYPESIEIHWSFG